MLRDMALADSCGAVRCSACGQEMLIQSHVPMDSDRRAEQCVLCGGQEFFIRKDFPQRLGMWLVVLTGFAATVFYYRENIPATFGTLFALVIVDAVIYLFVGKVTVCYKCRAEYRGAAYNPDHHGFDLATSEKYDP